jgi:cytochrome c oxidase assembly factor 1
VAGLTGWAAFLTYVTNREKISSSVVRQIMRSVRDDPQLKEVLGEAIRPQPEWWLNGDPRINGGVSEFVLAFLLGKVRLG